jgi:hypothetical protein
MRTTIELSEEAYYIAKNHAAERRISLGRAISDLILTPRMYSVEAPAAKVVRENQRRWPSVHVDQVMTVDRAKALLDDTE